MEYNTYTALGLVWLIAIVGSLYAVGASVYWLAGAKRSRNERLKGAFLLLLAVVVYGGLYSFERRAGTSPGTSAGSALRFGSLAYLGLWWLGKAGIGWATGMRMSLVDLRARRRNPGAYAAYREELARQWRNETYHSDEAAVVREELWHRTQKTPELGQSSD